MDPKAVVDATTAIRALLSEIYKKTCIGKCEYDAVEVASSLGRAFGLAQAIEMQCEQAGKPKMRGVEG